ncbi:ImmA/IrrE family metallo-endopeptidase [Flavobacterium sp.]|uniref:ImmA/IrrE family metallo-endopeptidase n=1 Tax=Flavobacterium sp. TaxID=239 RepID=UPI0025EADA91|nr:ImmA/IrrE family metallo-endopeptidase [Flavobacterium sp.]
MRTEVKINPNLITWAIARAGFDVEKFLENNPSIQNWIEEVKKPTVKQLEAFATRVHIPFGYLFMPEPPNESIPFPFFRTGNNNTDKVSLNVFDTIQILQRRQDWITDYLIDNDHEPLTFVGKFNENTNANTIVVDIRNTLSLQANWACNFATFEDTLAFITHKIEEIGIFINFNGVVENNTHRPISVDECRGFVLVNQHAPFMFINAADAKAAQLFTIIHELAHIWLGESAGFDNQNLLPANDPVEKLCDAIAAEFLVPASSLIDIWKDKPSIEYARRYFKVSPIVIARRAMDLGLITRGEFFTFYNGYMDSFKQKKENQGSGGDFYATARKRVSVSFATYVNQAVNQNKLLYRDAYKITGLKGDTYQKFVTQHLH